jgi:hypothetical protein
VDLLSTLRRLIQHRRLARGVLHVSLQAAEASAVWLVLVRQNDVEFTVTVGCEFRAIPVVPSVLGHQCVKLHEGLTDLICGVVRVVLE